MTLFHTSFLVSGEGWQCLASLACKCTISISASLVTWCIPHVLVCLIFPPFVWTPVIRLGPAAAKSCQSCPTLCDPIDSSLPGSPNPIQHDLITCLHPQRSYFQTRTHTQLGLQHISVGGDTNSFNWRIIALQCCIGFYHTTTCECMC